MLTLRQKVIATVTVFGMNLTIFLFGGILALLTLVPSIGFLAVLLRR